MSQLGYVVATHYWDNWLDCVKSWEETAANDANIYIEPKKTVLEAYQHGYERSTEPILAFIHDDVKIYEKNWDLRVLKQFEDPKVGMVGFGGALRHGSPDLYWSPYQLQQLGRSHFMSNLRNAESHGARFTGERDVAIFDGFALFVRRSLLDEIGGWRQESGYFMYSEALCCEARRHGYKLRLVGVDCEHLSGKTASMVQLTDSHADAHKWLYSNYRDVLPYAVGGV